MTSLLLAVIYIAFISLGLPDSLLGSAWPSMYGAMGVPLSFAGIVSMIIAGGTIVSSLFSDKLIRRLGTALVTLLSVAMTAVALLGFGFSGAFWQLCLWAVPYGLGAGSVDTALNNFVALHYKSRHMSWLHCFWGVGATLGPYIMGLCLAGGGVWNDGYRTIGILQVVLVACLGASLPLWKRAETPAQAAAAQQTADAAPALTLRGAVALPGAKNAMIAFFCYCALESTTGLWGASYLVLKRGLDAQTAAKWASLFYLGITIGRFVSGFISERLGDRGMVRLGQCLLVAGVALLLLPLGSGAALAGLLCIGAGCAPVFPSLLHATPENFGARDSQALMGMQMASAYTGSTLMPPLFGVLSGWVGLGLYPLYLLLFAVLMAVMTERLNRLPKPQRAA